MKDNSLTFAVGDCVSSTEGSRACVTPSSGTGGRFTLAFVAAVTAVTAFVAAAVAAVVAVVMVIQHVPVDTITTQMNASFKMLCMF